MKKGNTLRQTAEVFNLNYVTLMRYVHKRDVEAAKEDSAPEDVTMEYVTQSFYKRPRENSK